MPPVEPNDGIDILRLQRFFCLDSPSGGITIEPEVLQSSTDVNGKIVRRNYK